MQRLLLAALLAAAVLVTLSSAWDRNHIYCCKIVFLKWQTFAESQQNRTLSRLADQRRLRNCSIDYRGDGDYWRMYWLRGTRPDCYLLLFDSVSADGVQFYELKEQSCLPNWPGYFDQTVRAPLESTSSLN